MSQKKKKMVANVEAEKAPKSGADNPMSKILMLVGIGALVIAGFVAAVALRQGGQREPIRLPAEEIKPAAAAKPTPAPWTYDSVTNQHWDPTHNHWHTGHPPNQGHPGAPATTAPDIPNPEPWQYDVASNQHFDPDHNHWHTGQPPADKVPAPAVPATAVVPEPPTTPPADPLAVEEAAEASAEPAPAP